MLLAAKYGDEKAKKYCEAGEEIYKKLVADKGKEAEIHDFKFSIV